MLRHWGASALSLKVSSYNRASSKPTPTTFPIPFPMPLYEMTAEMTAEMRKAEMRKAETTGTTTKMRTGTTTELGKRGARWVL